MGKTILFADVLGIDAADVTNGQFLTSFGVGVQGGNSIMLYNDGVFADKWSFTQSYTGLVYRFDDDNPNATPEPATLLMLGLGAIGAGLAARRKMRNEK